ncbi:MAG: hypothetical protein IKL09_06640, partial [Clostridia bacterium]|nr:hypothetical protein [Clostridia bacterium]
RAAARDLYDWGNMIQEKLFEEDRDMFRKCFIFYATISAETVNRNFDTSAIDSLSFNKIRRDLFPVLNKKDNFMLEERKQQAKDYIKELMQLVFRYESSVSENLTAHKHNLNLIQEKLRMLNPLYFINKGFVPVYKDDNRIIRTTDIKVNDNISIHLSDGRLCCEVKEIITEN